MRGREKGSRSADVCFLKVIVIKQSKVAEIVRKDLLEVIVVHIQLVVLVHLDDLVAVILVGGLSFGGFTGQRLSAVVHSRLTHIDVVVIAQLAQLDLFLTVGQHADIECQGLQFLNQNLEGLRHAGLGDVLALGDGLVGLDAADDIVGLDRQDLLQGMLMYGSGSSGTISRSSKLGFIQMLHSPSTSISPSTPCFSNTPM